MRVTTNTLYSQTLSAMQTQQALQAKLQAQMSSGLRIQTAADDPVGAARVLNLQKGLADVDQWQTNTTTLQTRLGIEDSALSGVNTLLTQIKSYALQGNTSSMSDSDRQTLVGQIKQAFSQLVGYANTQDENGRYLFAGTQSAAVPFTQVGSTVTYSGNGQSTSLAVGPTSAIMASDPGDGVFMNIKSGDGTISVASGTTNGGTGYVQSAAVTDPAAYDAGTYTVTMLNGSYNVTDSSGNAVASGAYAAGTAIQFRGISLTVAGVPQDGDTFSVGPARSQDLFTTLNNLMGALGTVGFMGGNSTAAAAQTNFYESLSSLQTAMDHINSVRSGVGARGAALDDAANRLSDLSTQLQTSIGGIQDTDYATATAQFSQSKVVLQAAQQSYAAIQGLSLFDYLR